MAEKRSRLKSEQINAKGSRSDSSSVSSFSSYRKLLLTLSRLLYILYCKCFRFGIICAFVSNTNAQDGVDMLPTALRHTAEDTATYFNHTRKVCCSIVFKFFFARLQYQQLTKSSITRLVSSVFHNSRLLFCSRLLRDSRLQVRLQRC